MHERLARFYRSESLAGAMGLYLPATAATRVVSFGRMVVLAWLMSREQFGLLGLALLVINVATPLCSLGAYEAIARYVPHYEAAGSVRAFVVRSGALVVVVGGALAVVMVAGSSVLGPIVFEGPSASGGWDGQRASLIRLCAGAAFALIVYWSVAAVLRGLRMFGALSLMELVSGLIFAGLAVAVAWVGHGTAAAVVWCYIVSVVVPGVAFGVGCAVMLARRQEYGSGGVAGAWPRVLRYGVWMAAAVVTWQLLLSWPMWRLNKVGGLEAAGVYNAARVIGQLVLVACGAMGTVISAAVTRRWEADGPAEAESLLRLAFKVVGLGLLVVCAVVGASSKWVLGVMRPDYAAGADVLAVMLAYFQLAGLVSLLVIWFALLEKTWWTLAVYGVGVLASVVFGQWFIGGAVQHWSGWSAVGAWVGGRPDTALGGAAWMGMAAVLVAAVVCVVGLWVEKREVGVGVLVVLGSSLLLVTHWAIMLGGTVVLVMASWWSDFAFDSADKALLRDGFRRLLYPVRPNR